MGRLGEALGSGVRALLATHTLWAIAAIIFVDELGVPSPVPSDLLMLLAGVEVRAVAHPLSLVFAIQEGASPLGTTGLAWFTRRVVRSGIERYG
jgi:membrane protein DedA with SNARE-associated domain